MQNGSYIDYSEKKFCDLIVTLTQNLSKIREIKTVCWNFLDTYPKRIFLDEIDIGIGKFENYILDNLEHPGFRGDQERLFKWKIGWKTLWSINEETRSPNGNYGDYFNDEFDIFKNAFNKLVTFFVKEGYVEDEIIGCFVVWSLLRDVAIEYFSNEFRKTNNYPFQDLTSFEECYEQFRKDNNNGLIPFERELFIFHLISLNKVSHNFYSEYEKFFEFEEMKAEEEAYNNFKFSLLKEKKKLPLLKDILTINDVDLMTGDEFEEFLVELFKRMGYKSFRTKASNDQGVDVVAEKDSFKFGIQAKCYTSNVSNKSIQEVVSGVKHYRLDRAIVITNSHFTKSAKDLAKSNEVILWEREILKEKINEFFAQTEGVNF